MVTHEKWKDPWGAAYRIKSQADAVSDADLQQINLLYPWASHTLDGRGRVVGNKNGRLYHPVCRLVDAFEDWAYGVMCGRKGAHVVEYGCYEGAYTIGLEYLGFEVQALDSRAINLANAAARCALYGADADFVLSDLERDMPLHAELAFHSGVLYHLTDPVAHLINVSDRTSTGILLDFTYSPTVTESYHSADGVTYPCKLNREGGVGAPKSGMQPIARWIRPDLVMDMLHPRWSHVEHVHDRDESQANGTVVRRATVLAWGKK